jgi:hypothetical protein
MKIEQHYLDALDLTHQMLEAANAQHWDELTRIEQQRSMLISSLQPRPRGMPPLDSAQARRITDLITEIERESAEIVEQVEVWQKHVRILLRLDRPAAGS